MELSTFQNKNVFELERAFFYEKKLYSAQLQ
jgi:hypothetical protein